jgi:uncharacterized delta-60 repeat protein
MEGRVGDWHGGGRRRSRRVASFLTAALVAVSLPLSGAAEGATSGPGSVDLGLGSCGVTEQASVDQLGSLGETTAPAVAVQPDGRILVADQADIYTERMYFVVTRLRPDGVVDLSFGVDGTARRPRDSMRLSVRGILVQPDGRVVVGGIAGTPFNDGARHLRFIRFRPDGTLDPTFGNEGQASIDTDGDLVALSLQPDGAVLGALSEHGQAVVVRVTTSGGLDPTFGLDGRAIAAEGDAGALSIQGDGRILVGSGRATGTTYWTDVQISRLLPSGSLDPSFGGSGTVTMDVAGGSDSVVAVGARDDGRVMTVGTASNRDGVAGIGLTRHLGSGEPDPTFGTGGKMVALGWGAVAAAVEGDGRTVVTTHVGPPGRHEFAIARFAANGELDPAFGDGGVTTTAFGSWEGEPQALARTPGGGWVVSGWVRVAVYGWFVRAVVRYGATAPPKPVASRPRAVARRSG